MAGKDLYEILGVSKGASAEDIKKAYRKLSRQFHPDVNPDDKAAEAKFKEVQNAYDILSDEEKRKQYDMFGSAGPRGSHAGGAWTGQGPVDFSSFFGGGGGSFDINDFFAGMGGGAGPGAGQRSNAGRGRNRGRPGEDLETDIEIPFRIAVLGGEHELQLNRGGSVSRLSVKIPAGINSGQVIRLAGQGGEGVFGGPPGALLVKVRVSADPLFRREGNDLLIDLPLTVPEAMLGTKVEVPTISDGNIKLTIPQGTSSGAKLRLRGKGVAGRDGNPSGDQYCVVKIVVPKNLDEASEKLVRQLEQHLPNDPRGGLW